jgi:hypothetical protein
MRHMKSENNLQLTWPSQQTGSYTFGLKNFIATFSCLTAPLTISNPGACRKSIVNRKALFFQQNLFYSKQLPKITTNYQ